jgi:trehalose 6-phosphate synthase/phosphatase
LFSSFGVAILLPGDQDAVRYRYCIFSGGLFKRWEGGGKIYRSLSAPVVDKIASATADHFGALSADEAEISPGFTETTTTTAVVAAPEVLSFRSRQFAEWSKKSVMDNSLTTQDGVIIVSYFLPVILSKSSSGKWSATWDGENLLSLSLNVRATWVGAVRFSGSLIPPEEEDAVSAVLHQMNCYPVFINQDTHYQFYDIFCKQNLWMLLHHVVDVYGPINQAEIGAKGQQDLWFTYSTVSRIFRDKVVEVFQQGDLVWVHGFHLMLLPSFLRRPLKDAKIGFFFHTPFPSAEIWRTLNRREDLLRGVLAADQVGFHLFEYARQFMTSCHRELGHNSGMNASGTLTVNVDGREVAITCIHTGVDLPRVKLALNAPTFEADVEAWKDKFPGKTIVTGK